MYGFVVALNVNGSLADDKLQQACSNTKIKNPKGQGFLFIHCWLVLKDVPRWGDLRERLNLGRQRP